MLDGEAWKAELDCSLTRVTPEARTPYAVVAEFSPGAPPSSTSRWRLKISTWLSVAGRITDRPDAVRIDGSFESVHVRSVPKQRKPYPPLAEAIAHQHVLELRDVTGSMVGFRFPDPLDGIEMTGFHLHFATDDRAWGGHVLSYRVARATVLIDEATDLHVELPPAVIAPIHGTRLDQHEITRLEIGFLSTIPGVSDPVVVILAAGEGTRMRSETPKLLHPICGRPMIGWAVAAAADAGAGKVVVVEGPRRELEPALDGRVEFAVQERPLGTADAVKAAASQIDPDRTVIVLYGDVPLITAETLRALADAHARSGAAATITSIVLDDPSGYGRVVRAPDGTVERVVETKTARRRHRARAPHPRDQCWDLRVRRGRAAAGARRGRNRQRPGRVLPPGRAARAALARADDRRVRDDGRDRDAGRQRSRRACARDAAGPGADPPPAHARRASRSSTPPQPSSTSASRSAATR